MNTLILEGNGVRSPVADIRGRRTRIRRGPFKPRTFGSYIIPQRSFPVSVSNEVAAVVAVAKVGAGIFDVEDDREDNNAESLPPPL